MHAQQTSSPGKPPRPVSSSSARRSSSSGPPSAGGGGSRRASSSPASPQQQQRGRRNDSTAAARTPSKLLGSTLSGTLSGTLTRGTRGGIASPSPLARTAGGGGFFGQSDTPVGASHSSAVNMNSKAGVKEKMRARAWAAFARKTVFLTLDDLPKEARPRTARKGGVTPFCLQLTKVSTAVHCIAQLL
jgi:hypothetical protein